MELFTTQRVLPFATKTWPDPRPDKVLIKDEGAVVRHTSYYSLQYGKALATMFPLVNSLLSPAIVCNRAIIYTICDPKQTANSCKL
ncbi:MAG: hypothetical protein ACRC5V_05330 [Aeromonas sp.]